MRLEEWQRFIETQFLAEEPEATPLSEPEEANTGPMAPAPELSQDVSEAESSPPAALPADRQPKRFSEQAAQLTDSPAQNAALPPPPVFSPPDVEDIEIPTFARYLPPFRQAEPSKRDVEAVEEAASVASRAAPKPSRPSPARNRRVIHTSGSEAAETTSPAAAAELWADVPKHIQMLLALERAEEEEVAQNSYKRPFAEKRRELIERLLNPVLSLEDTARLLNVCPTTVRRYTNKGLLICHRKETERLAEDEGPATKETRQRRFRLSDILAFLETQQAVTVETENKTSRRRKRDSGEELPAVEKGL